MTRDCGCAGGDCGGPILPRREFIQTLAVTAAGAALVGAEAARARPLPPVPKSAGGAVRQSPRVYSGEYLEYVLMPIGGLGTGTIWLDGQGRLAVWQIFNNFSEMRVPDSFFGIRARVGGEAVSRVLQTEPEAELTPVDALTYEGGYPIARLRFSDAALPVEVMLEAYNPLLPLDATASGYPGAVFRWTVRNPGTQAAEVSLLAALQNAVGCGGANDLSGYRHAAYGRNQNAVTRAAGRTVVMLGREQSPPENGPMKVRDSSGAEVAGPAAYWLDQLGGIAETAGDATTTQIVEGARRMMDDGGGLVVGRAAAEFFTALGEVRAERAEWDALTVFADFDGDDYGGWTAEGEAFGTRPSRGTERGQQQVSGFLGRGLINSFIAGDAPQGTLTSPPFVIEQRYLGFLLGGGNHPRECCLNLVIDGQVVRTATGRDNERLEPRTWDVGEFAGRTATLQAVDRRSDGWGHINVDHIVFADVPPEALFRLRGPLSDLMAALPLTVTGASDGDGGEVTWSDAGRRLAGDPPAFAATARTALDGLELGDGAEVLATFADGAPAVLLLPVGRSRWVVSLAEGLPETALEPLLLAARGAGLAAGERLVTASTRYGTMALACDREAGGTAAWRDAAELTGPFVATGRLDGPDAAGPSPSGETINAALCPTFTVAPGASETVSFALTWHFPNVDRFGHPGNAYSLRFPDATAVANELLDQGDELWGWTRLYHETVYESNLPEPLLDAYTSQSVIARGPTCWWSEEGYFAGFEGCYGCCPLNCTHVWNYAQTHARLWPEIDRNLRESDLITYLLESGETQHRQHSRHGAFVDGHCAVIEGALRAHQTCADESFVQRIWPNTKKAMEWLIATFDTDEDGVLAGHHWNTYDCATGGAHTFCGSQYLAALGAAGRLAGAAGDTTAAARYAELRAKGAVNQDRVCWSEEHQYYIQVPDERPAHDYNTGCHSDQLLGQWWAHMLDLGYLYPEGHVKAALTQIVAHNFRSNFDGFEQRPRRYVPDDEPGLLMCSWPTGGRPEPFIIYADEIWTGIEYSTAGLLIYEGMIDEAVAIVTAARSRYDGRRRDGLNSGPGGNPFNELECGKFYARAMSSGGLLPAAQGLILDGPAGLLGFAPRWQPDNHRSFYLAAEGWGLFSQQITPTEQRETIEVRYGRLRLRELRFAAPARLRNVEVRLDGRVIPHRRENEGGLARLVFNAEQVAADRIEVRFA